MTLLLQKEVAQRICASPGEMSLLSISVQLYGRPKIISYVSKDSFWPKPVVDSAIIQIDQIVKFPFTKIVSEKKFWQTVKSGFCSKRKQLKNNLANSLHLSTANISQILEKSGIGLSARAQELSIENWTEVARQLVL
jgi:16S rRNA (adenine1518-N6/adenine1519-N6)-dimethyltransferase